MPDGCFKVVCVPWQLHVSSRDETGDDHYPWPGVMGAILSDRPRVTATLSRRDGPQAALSNDDRHVSEQR
jgi:hypothetical protein